MKQRDKLWARLALGAWVVAGLCVVALCYRLLFRAAPADSTGPDPGIPTTAVIEGPGGHAYQFVHAPNITWDAARAAAAQLSWHGKPGYLATIDNEAERAFIASHVVTAWNNTTYVGGRQTAPREWRWVTGPDGAMDGGKGKLFWLGDEAGATPTGSYAVWQQSAFQHGGRWDARAVCCVTLYSYGLAQLSTSLGTGYWEEGVSGYLVEFGD